MTAELLRVLVVDDEEPARQRLVDLLRRDTGVGGIVGSVGRPGRRRQDSTSGPTWCSSTCRCRSSTAWASSRRSARRAMPLTVFVTAYDKHAVQRLRGQRSRLPAQAVQRRAPRGDHGAGQRRLGERDLRGFGQRAAMASQAPDGSAGSIGWS